MNKDKVLTVQLVRKGFGKALLSMGTQGIAGGIAKKLMENGPKFSEGSKAGGAAAMGLMIMGAMLVGAGEHILADVWPNEKEDEDGDE